MRSHQLPGVLILSACFSSSDGELIKKKDQVKGSSCPPSRNLGTFLSKGPEGGPAFSVEVCDERRAGVWFLRSLCEMVAGAWMTTHGKEQGDSAEGNPRWPFHLQGKPVWTEPTRVLSGTAYLMFFRTAVRAFTTALKASSLPGATHLSGWSSTASLRYALFTSSLRKGAELRVSARARPGLHFAV